MATKEEAVDALIYALDEYVIEQADINNLTPTRVKLALRKALLDIVGASKEPLPADVRDSLYIKGKADGA